MKLTTTLILALSPTLLLSQVVWKDFSLHVLRSDVRRELCVDLVYDQTFTLIEFDRTLPGGSVTIKTMKDTIPNSPEEQRYPVNFTTSKVCLSYESKEDFWIKFETR